MHKLFLKIKHLIHNSKINKIETMRIFTSCVLFYRHPKIQKVELTI